MITYQFMHDYDSSIHPSFHPASLLFFQAKYVWKNIHTTLFLQKYQLQGYLGMYTYTSNNQCAWRLEGHKDWITNLFTLSLHLILTSSSPLALIFHLCTKVSSPIILVVTSRPLHCTLPTVKFFQFYEGFLGGHRQCRWAQIANLIAYLVNNFYWNMHVSYNST